MNKQRLERVLKKMEEKHLPQIIITSTSSMFYLTGHWIEPRERMMALLISQDGSYTFFGNEIFGLENTPELPIVTHKDGENPVKDLAAALKPGVLGVDKFWMSKFLIGLQSERPDVTTVEGSSPVDEVRQFKDAQEIEAMRFSSRMNDEVVMAAIANLKEGMTELEAASFIASEYMKRGSSYVVEAPMACFGVNGADPHHASCQDKLKVGDSVTFDIFTPFNNYWCDMTRTVFFGEATDEQKRVYEAVRQANLAGIAAVKPGVMLKDVDAAGRKVIEDAGYGPNFLHRIGHNIGIDVHELPDVGGTLPTIAQPGMIFSIEPGIYLPGKFGVRIEDLVLVTEDGCEVLNKAPKDFTIVK